MNLDIEEASKLFVETYKEQIIKMFGISGSQVEQVLLMILRNTMIEWQKKVKEYE